jgi:hypothetical protein
MLKEVNDRAIAATTGITVSVINMIIYGESMI